MPSAIFGKFVPIGLAAMPVSCAPLLFGFLSALTSNLSPSPVRGTESLMHELRLQF